MKLSDIILLEAKQTFYHGSNTKIDKFSLDKLGSNTNIDQSGPGIYLSSSKHDASTYGKYIHTVDAKIIKSRLLTKSVRTIEKGIQILINKAPDIEDILTNWDENPVRAKLKALHTIVDSHPKYLDALEQTWFDFYPDDSKLYLQQLIKWTYQGFLITINPEITHFICWDPSILTIQSVEQQ